MRHTNFALALIVLGTSSVALPTFAQDAMTRDTEMVAPVNTHSAAFVKVDAKTTGTSRIITKNGRTYVELSKNFTLGDAPAPVVTLYKAAVPPKKGYEAGQYLSLAPLKSFKGRQRYVLPANTDLTEYQSVAIWCKKFDVTLAYAPIAR
jgi:Electron transfer DM13